MRFQLNTHCILVFIIGLGPIGCSANESGQTGDTTAAADDELVLDTDIDLEVENTPPSEVDDEIPDTALDDASTEMESEDSDGDLPDSGPADVPTAEDGTPCWGIQYPQLGCPCDPSAGTQECCIHVAYGQLCSGFFRQWVEFGDCGCDPRCGPTFSLCIAPPPKPEE